MDKKSIWKWLVLLVLIIGSVWMVTPVKDKVRLGLDLRGGTSFVVQMDEAAIAAQIREENHDLSEEAVQARLPEKIKQAQDRALEVIRNRVDGLGISEPVIYPEKNNRIVVQLPGVDAKKRDEAARAIQSAAFLEFRIVHEDNYKLVEELFDKGVAPEGYTIASLESRGARRNYYKRDRKTVPDGAMDQAFREKLAKFHAPPGYEFMLEREKVGDQYVYSPYFVERRRQLTGDSLQNAAVDYQALGQAVVTLQFDAKGARKFGVVTSDYAPGGAKNPNPQTGRMLAIIMDGTLYSAPVIREPIHGGRAEISGSFTPTEAMFLANVLRAGSLPAPVQIVERRVVDPTLGSDSIHSGVTAGLYGCIAILVLMAAYYMVNGLVADLTLILNVVLLPLAMIVVAGFLGVLLGNKGQGGAVALPVLTLPGIAGIALSIGMAVDANVLIFERIREELKSGKGFKASVDAGFARAFSAIFDSNITTIITAVIMFIVGSGAIRGYAITLTAGLLINLYTAVLVAHMCYDLMAARGAQTKILRMFSVIRETTIDFIGIWKIPLAISCLIIAVSWVLMFMHGRQDPTRVFAVDFTGGTALTLGFAQKPGVDEIRAALGKAGVRDAQISYQKGMEPGAKETLQVKVATVKEGALTGDALTNQFPQAAFTVLQQDDVGPQVGKELKVKAFMALGLGLVAMIIYIAIRFEFGFGLGAVVATFHDAMITIGICHLLGLQLNMTIIAAVLTIIGYSVNDTIVIFDRIRENLRMVHGKSFMDICNLSVNQTLARTLLTNFFTFISVVFLLFLGGGALKDFSVAMFIGMIAGTYSTVYIATPVVLLWYRFQTPTLGSARSAK